MDELILADDEMLDLAPEDLPRRVLSDFAVYNAEGFCSSLELLPMWSGVDSDVDLYASGNVLDDDGEWAGGQTLSAGAKYIHQTIQRYFLTMTCHARDDSVLLHGKVLALQHSEACTCFCKEQLFDVN